jgi:hypothetical protein
MSDELSGQPVPLGSEGLVGRAKGILMSPKTEWQRIAGETTEPMKVLTSYVVPLALIGPIASLIGMQVFGINAVIVTFRPSLASSLTMAVTSFVLTIVGVFVLAFIANWLSPKFGGKEDFPAAFRWVAYAMTASWIGGIFGLIPSLAIIGLLFGLYSLYLLYLGSSPMMGVPQDKTLGYTVVTILAAIVLYVVVGMVTTAVAGTTGLMAGAVASDQLDQATINLGELGSVSVDGENSSVDLGELGKVEIDGDTATLTVDGQEVEMDMAEVQAAAEAAAAEAEARTAE